MDFLKVKTVIKQNFKAACVFMLSATVICGCGVKTVTCIDAAQTGNSQKVGSHAGVSLSADVMAKGTETGKRDGSKVIKLESIEHESKLYKIVPVYGKSEKKKIKKYLASLPDKITEEKAKENGIVIQPFNFNDNRFNTMWNGFYKYVREAEKELKPQKGVIKCYAEPFRAAIVLLRYTTEGDACYTYISFIEGEYYVMDDNSRDKFMKCEGDGISEIGTFKSLRKRKKLFKDGNNSYYNVTYAVFKKPGISKKRIKKVIKEVNSYANKYYDLYDYYISNNKK